MFFCLSCRQLMQLLDQIKYCNQLQIEFLGNNFEEHYYSSSDTSRPCFWYQNIFVSLKSTKLQPTAIRIINVTNLADMQKGFDILINWILWCLGKHILIFLFVQLSFVLRSKHVWKHNICFYFPSTLSTFLSNIDRLNPMYQ